MPVTFIFENGYGNALIQQCLEIIYTCLINFGRSRRGQNLNKICRKFYPILHPSYMYEIRFSSSVKTLLAHHSLWSLAYPLITQTPLTASNLIHVQALYLTKFNAVHLIM